MGSAITVPSPFAATSAEAAVGQSFTDVAIQVYRIGFVAVWAADGVAISANATASVRAGAIRMVTGLRAGNRAGMKIACRMLFGSMARNFHYIRPESHMP